MKLRFINVGYGEAMLLTAQRADGEAFHMLIDGGSGEAAEYAGHPSRVRAAEQLGQLGVARLDVLLNTHIHEDHTCGLLAVVERCEIGEYWCCALPENAAAWPALSPEIITLPCSEKCLQAFNAHREMTAAFRRRGVPIRMLSQGTRIQLPAKGLSAEVVGPCREEVNAMLVLMERLFSETDREKQKQWLLDVDRNMNNHSVMLLMDYYGVKILLPGDTNCLGYGHLPAEKLKADVFKLGHHGQLDGADEALVKAVSPRLLAVCASSDRRYGSMHPEVLRLFRDNDAATKFLLSDTPELPPWSDGVQAHRASEVTIDQDGGIWMKYIV